MSEINKKINKKNHSYLTQYRILNPLSKKPIGQLNGLNQVHQRNFNLLMKIIYELVSIKNTMHSQTIIYTLLLTVSMEY